MTDLLRRAEALAAPETSIEHFVTSAHLRNRVHFRATHFRNHEVAIPSDEGASLRSIRHTRRTDGQSVCAQDFVQVGGTAAPFSTRLPPCVTHDCSDWPSPRLWTTASDLTSAGSRTRRVHQQEVQAFMLVRQAFGV